MIQYGFRRPVARDAPDRTWLIEHEQLAPSHHEYLPADLVRRRRHQCHRDVGVLVGAHEILDALDANPRCFVLHLNLTAHPRQGEERNYVGSNLSYNGREQWWEKV